MLCQGREVPKNKQTAVLQMAAPEHPRKHAICKQAGQGKAAARWPYQAHLVDNAQVVERIEQGTPHEELHGQVVHALGIHIPALACSSP